MKQNKALKLKKKKPSNTRKIKHKHTRTQAFQKKNNETRLRWSLNALVAEAADKIPVTPRAQDWPITHHCLHSDGQSLIPYRLLLLLFLFIF